MTEAPRYDRDDPLLDALFAASRAETPSARAVEKTLTAIGAAGTVLSAAAATHAASSALATKPAASVLGWAMLAKWTGVGVGAGLVTVAAAGVAQRWVAPPATTVASVASVAAPIATRPVPRAAGPRLVADEPVPADETWSAAPRRGDVALARPAPASGATPKPAGPEAVTDALQKELLCIDTARAALEAGRASDALSQSERCEREHPGGRLALEALLIRMYALKKLGQGATARALAERLIALAPKSPHAARARAVLESKSENSVIDPPPAGEPGSR